MLEQKFVKFFRCQKKIFWNYLTFSIAKIHNLSYQLWWKNRSIEIRMRLQNLFELFVDMQANCYLETTGAKEEVKPWRNLRVDFHLLVWWKLLSSKVCVIYRVSVIWQVFFKFWLRVHIISLYFLKKKRQGIGKGKSKNQSIIPTAKLVSCLY